MAAQTPTSFFPTWQDNKPLALALLLAFAFLIVFLMAKTTQALVQTRRISTPTPIEYQITIEGAGKVTGVPDIASISMGIESKSDTVAAAQQANTDGMNALINRIAALGIAKDDMQTANYSVYQNTTYDPDTGVSAPAGWTVSQQLTVKVRDTAKISEVLDTAGKNGATNVSGPNFTIDDPSSLKAQAREKALADATEKAAALAKTLGLRLAGVVGYSEYQDNGPVPYFGAMAMDKSMTNAAPEILPGTNDVSLNVSVTYRIAE